MSKQSDALAMREAILDAVVRLYHESSVDSPWTEMPPHIQEITQEIFELVTNACGIKE